mmetsp:Transcript_6924/g.12833  ORF Transcript_6924/g.12833 Transcript_6924/m.12833 type:complete len:395 (-) Transcript_6924:166-1350(-)
MGIAGAVADNVSSLCGVYVALFELLGDMLFSDPDDESTYQSMRKESRQRTKERVQKVLERMKKSRTEVLRNSRAGDPPAADGEKLMADLDGVDDSFDASTWPTKKSDEYLSSYSSVTPVLQARFAPDSKPTKIVKEPKDSRPDKVVASSGGRRAAAAAAAASTMVGDGCAKANKKDEAHTDDGFVSDSTFIVVAGIPSSKDERRDDHAKVVSSKNTEVRETKKTQDSPAEIRTHPSSLETELRESSHVQPAQTTKRTRPPLPGPTPATKPPKMADEGRILVRTQSLKHCSGIVKERSSQWEESSNAADGSVPWTRTPSNSLSTYGQTFSSYVPLYTNTDNWKKSKKKNMDWSVSSSTIDVASATGSEYDEFVKKFTRWHKEEAAKVQPPPKYLI